MQIHKDNGQTEISVTITSYYSLIFIFGTAAFVTSLFLLISIYCLVFVKETTLQPEMIGYLVWSPIFISVTLWFLKGEEKIILTDSKIVFIRSNGFLKFSRTRDLCDISTVKLADDAFPPDNFVDKNKHRIQTHGRAIPFWTKMGKLSFDFKNKTVTFFNGLNKSQADELLIILTDEIKTRCKNNQSVGNST